MSDVLLPYLRSGDGRAVVHAEEWHTVEAVLANSGQEPFGLVGADVRAMRHHGVLTARRSVWSEVIERNLLPPVELVLSRQATRPPARRVPRTSGARRAPQGARRKPPGAPGARPPQRGGNDLSRPAEPRSAT